MTGVSDALVEWIARMPAQTCGDFDCDAEVGERAAREILAAIAAIPPEGLHDAWRSDSDPIARLRFIADNADPLGLATVQVGDLRALVAEHRTALQGDTPQGDTHGE